MDNKSIMLDRAKSLKVDCFCIATHNYEVLGIIRPFCEYKDVKTILQYNKQLNKSGDLDVFECDECNDSTTYYFLLDPANFLILFEDPEEIDHFLSQQQDPPRVIEYMSIRFDTGEMHMFKRIPNISIPAPL